jgi:hypothetical protein
MRWCCVSDDPTSVPDTQWRLISPSPGMDLPISRPIGGSQLTPPHVRGLLVAHFITIGYGDEAGYEQTDQAVRDAAHTHDARLRESGVDMGIAGSPVQVRNHDAAGLSTQDGPFMSSALPVAGFAIIEAATLSEAIDMVSGTPCAVAHGVVEVWPLQQPT